MAIRERIAIMVRGIAIMVRGNSHNYDNRVMHIDRRSRGDRSKTAIGTAGQ
jgi:hypothetical protein